MLPQSVAVWPRSSRAVGMNLHPALCLRSLHVLTVFAKVSSGRFISFLQSLCGLAFPGL